MLPPGSKIMVFKTSQEDGGAVSHNHGLEITKGDPIDRRRQACDRYRDLGSPLHCPTELKACYS